MKKRILVLGIICILLTGCGNESKDDKIDTQNKTTISSSTTSITTTSSSTTSTSSTKSTKKKTTTTIPTTKDKTTIKADKEHIYKSVKTGKEHKYSYVYKDEETCKKRADGDAYDTVNPKHPYVAFGCEEIKNSSGAILWGVFFYKEADENSIFYY